VKKKKWQHAKTVGNKTESIVSTWFSELGINIKQEDTMRNTRTRNKGGIDFENDSIAIEVKHFTKSLTVKYKSEDHDLKWSQVELLNKKAIKGKISGLLITEDNETFYFIGIVNFILWWVDCKRKSINADIAKEIGYVVKCKEDLKRIIDRRC